MLGVAVRMLALAPIGNSRTTHSAVQQGFSIRSISTDTESVASTAPEIS